MKVFKAPAKAALYNPIFDYCGPIKVKDGLYLGNQFASRDFDFVAFNKVNFIINCSHKALQNSFQKMGIRYLNFQWTNSKTTLDSKTTLEQIFKFIETAMQEGQCCLVVSSHGKSRSTSTIIAYLMKKYNWSLKKALDYMNTKTSTDLRPAFLDALRRIQCQLDRPSEDWQKWNNEEEEVLRNTFLNVKIIVPEKQRVKCTRKIKWSDQIQGKRGPVKPQGKSTKNQVINNVHGNCINITVNNYIVDDLKKVKPKKQDKMVTIQHYFDKQENKRPHSSDNKDRRKKQQQIQQLAASKLKPKKKKIQTQLSMYSRPKGVAKVRTKKEQSKETDFVVTNSMKKSKLGGEGNFYSTWN